MKLIAPARKPEWGESFWDLKTFAQLGGRKASGILLALPTLAALTPAGVEIVIIDENVEPIDFSESVDLVGISFLTSVAPRAYEIADIYRAQGVKVVLGGIHSSMLPEEAIEHADSVVIGEAEEIWEKLIDDFRSGTLQKFYEAETPPNLQHSPVPRWDLLKADAYSYFTIQTGRGCPHNCDFCAVHVYNGRRYRYKSIDNVIKELELLKSIKPKNTIFFADDNFLAKPSHAKELLKAIEPLNIRFWAQISIDRLDDEEVLSLLYKAGCRVIFIGIESVSQRSLDSINKSKVNNVEKYGKVIDKIHSAGIGVFGSFIMGMDTDDTRIFKETADFINSNNIPFPMVNILTPLPGTKMHDVLENEKRITNSDWNNFDAEHLCIMPRNIPPEELLAERSKLLLDVYSYPALYKRLCFLWDKGVFIRDREKRVSRFTKGRILFTLKSLFSTDVRRTWFILKGLWYPRTTSVSFLAMAIGFHDYFYNIAKKTKHTRNL